MIVNNKFLFDYHRRNSFAGYGQTHGHLSIAYSTFDDAPAHKPPSLNFVRLLHDVCRFDRIQQQWQHALYAYWSAWSTNLAPHWIWKVRASTKVYSIPSEQEDSSCRIYFGCVLDAFNADHPNNPNARRPFLGQGCLSSPRSASVDVTPRGYDHCDGKVEPQGDGTVSCHKSGAMDSYARNLKCGRCDL